MIEIFYVDASTKNNGQFGFQESRICVTDNKGKVLVDHLVGDKTNIEAEALAILSAFKRVDQLKLPVSEIRTDSQFWVKTVNFRWKLKQERLFPLRDKLMEMHAKTKATLLWVPREQNFAGIFLENNISGKRKEPEVLAVCPHCGKPLNTPPSQLSEDSNTPAI